MKKVIFITGASSGMGKDGALRLIREGHTVYGAARRLAHMQELKDAGGHAIEVDVSNIDSIHVAVSDVIRAEGRIDVLWNNAGYSVAGAVEDVSYEDAKRQFEINLFGLAEVTKAVLPHMRSQGSGTIINTSSVGGKIFSPLSAWYHASKHALEGWSDCLRLELSPFNIHVVILEPGGIKTEFGQALHQPLLDRSKGGPYEKFAKRIAESYASMYSERNKKLSPPSVISDTIVKIVDSRRPKTRYAVGYMANTVLWMRRLISDRMFEKIIMGQYK